MLGHESFEVLFGIWSRISMTDLKSLTFESYRLNCHTPLKDHDRKLGVPLLRRYDSGTPASKSYNQSRARHVSESKSLLTVGIADWMG